MGENAAQTVTEIEQTRERLEHNLRELEDRLPPPAVLGKRAVGILVGGGLGGTIALKAIRRMRRRKQGAQAATKGSHPTVINVIPEDWAERVSNGRLAKAVETGEWKPWAAGAVGAWFLLRAAELRRLKKLNRALLNR